MIKATKKDKELVVELLTESFQNNQSVNYIIGQDSKRLEQVRALMEYSIDVCSLFGEVLLSENKKASALILYPHLKKTTLKSIFLDWKLIFRVIGITGILKTLKREALIKKKQPKKPMAYLWFIGVNPANQHCGIGSILLKEVLALAEEKGLPVYLETSTLKNLPWYQHLGFKKYDELTLTYVLHFMKYELIN
jgi:GNAT superfamily N-acetyltransferase